ncbi:MAG: NUDIX domain-containing protein [Candidatus Thorarchaeota archaeon]
MIGEKNVALLVFKSNPAFRVLLVRRKGNPKGQWQPLFEVMNRDEHPLTAAERCFRRIIRGHDPKRIFHFDFELEYRDFITRIDLCCAAEIEQEIPIVMPEDFDNYEWCGLERAEHLLEVEKEMDFLREVANLSAWLD